MPSRSKTVLALTLVLIAFPAFSHDSAEHVGTSNLRAGRFALAVPAPMNDLIVIQTLFHVNDRFAIRPGFGISLTGLVDKSNPIRDVEESTFEASLGADGLRYFRSVSNLHGYAGAGIALAYRSDRIDDGVVTGDLVKSYFAFSIAPLAGAQMMFHPQFGVFGEVGLLFSFGGTGNAFDEQTATRVSTFTQRLGVIFYFD